MWSFELLVLFYFSANFRVDSLSDNNTTDIVNVNKSDCGLFSDIFASKLNLKSLCPMSNITLKEIQIKTVYDATPLLCFQFYQTNVKLCNLNNSNLNKALILREVEDVEKFMNGLRSKYKDINDFCVNAEKLWREHNPGNSDSNVYNNSTTLLHNYFLNVITNLNSCKQFCSSKLDGKVTDLCDIIVWQKDLINNMTQPTKTTAAEVDELGSLSNVGTSKHMQRENIDVSYTKNHDTKDNGPSTIGVNSKVAAFDNSKNIKAIPESVVSISQNAEKKSVDPDAQQKVITEEDTNKELENFKSTKIVSPVLTKSVEKLNNQNLDGDIYYHHGVGGEENENPPGVSEGREEDNIDQSILQPNALGNNEKPGFPEIQESGKLPLDQENTLMSMPFDNHQEPDMNGYRRDRLMESEDSHFFTYFVSMGVVCGIMYILFHNKKKILALAVEGRRSRPHGGNHRRPNTASYSKLDSNLEEAMVSNVSQASVTHVLY